MTGGHTFFLSRARPMAGTDPWVQRMFRDLSERVAPLLGAGEPETVGFYDDMIAPDGDWKNELAQALGAADVFVALYSPRYVGNAWSMREREAFLRRLRATGTGSADTHLLPVLWVPMPPGRTTPDSGAALMLGDGVPGYADNGLRALCMLRAYRDQYEILLERLAYRIAEVAMDNPLPMSPVTFTSTGAAENARTAFTVAVLTDDTAELQWRPFARSQALPLAEVVAAIAERLGLPTRIIDVRKEATGLDSGPAVLLVDPWLPSGEDEMPALSALLRPWVTPLIVADRDDTRYAERGAETITAVTGRLQSIGARKVWQMLDIEEIGTLMPTLFVRARREYLLRHAVAVPPARTVRRPRLSNGARFPRFGGEENQS
jgi:FxsC-like protein